LQLRKHCITTKRSYSDVRTTKEVLSTGGRRNFCVQLKICAQTTHVLVTQLFMLSCQYSNRAKVIAFCRFGWLLSQIRCATEIRISGEARSAKERRGAKRRLKNRRSKNEEARSDDIKIEEEARSAVRTFKRTSNIQQS